MVSVHLEPVRWESIFLIDGELPGSGLATEGTANSETQFGASRRAMLGTEQHRVGMKISILNPMRCLPE